MVRSIEIPEPLFEADVNPRWDHDTDEDVFNCVVLVGGKFTVYEKTFRFPAMQRNEDEVRDEFLAEFADKFKRLMEKA